MSTNTEQKKVFPNGFVWGASTAAYQVEGGIDNTDWADAARAGKVPECGRACDHYNHYEEDFDLITALSQNAHRFSIEWARIEPREGEFNKEEIEHYRKVIRSLRRRGITPFINLWHFTLPSWFSQSGGFFRADGAKVFARYCAYVIEHLGDESDHWLTINEPEIWSYNSFLTKKWPPFVKNPFTYFRAMRALAKAHCAAYAAMKKIAPHASIGIAKNNTYFDPGKNVFARPWAALLTYVNNEWFLEMMGKCHDFIGLNHYFHEPIGWKVSASVVRSDMHWEIHPDSLYHCLLDLKKYNLPVYVTENGIADREDQYRADYIRGYLGAVHRAIQSGVQVEGYFHWSLLDNYEWAEGFTQRFGLVAIDYATLKRTIRASARVYAEICRTNTLV